MKTKAFSFFFVILPFSFLLLPLGSARALTMANPSYTLEGETNFAVEEKEPVLPKVLGEQTEKPKVNIPFAFSVAPVVLDFGTLAPTVPVNRATTLSLSHAQALGYTVVAFENDELTNAQANRIPDTTCDDSACSESRTANWINPLTFGFGYRCDNVIGSDCPNDFAIGEKVFTQFTNRAKQERETLILKNSVSGRSKKAVITTKLNVSGTQELGHYENTVTFIAIPNF